MATKKKLLEAAAGAAGGAGGLNVEEVFSTYLWNGNSVNSGDYQTIENSIALGNFGLGTSTEFTVGNTDYLARSSDLTGNANGKTFTFSAWFYHNMSSANDLILYRVGSGIFHITIKANNKVQIGAYNGGDIIDVRTTDYDVPQKKWNHLLISMDTSVGNTTKTHIYLNDVSLTGGLTSTTVVNSDIDFTQSSHNVHRYADSLTSRGAHMYLDYTYRDLSTASNRRLFIDANGGSTSPSTLSALSPILYLPMTEDYSIGENLGTGGDFTANGSPTIIQSGTEYQADYGEGGLVWIKNRDTAYNHWLFDTDRGVNKYLEANSTSVESTRTKALTSFNSNGFTVGTDAALNLNGDGIASWTFRKAPKFFDVVTYTGNGVAGRTVSHNLGTTVGALIIKRTDTTGEWIVYHKDISSINNVLFLNSTSGEFAYSSFNSTAPTSTEFTLGTRADVNASGGTYVAYLFAHNDGDGDFGDGTQDIIKCGSYTLGSNYEAEIDLGWEPQWLLTKKTNSTGGWYIHDNMRGMTYNNDGVWFYADTSDAEVKNTTGGRLRATGFNSNGQGSPNDQFIYIAIRRGPMAAPESATDVFGIATRDGTEPGFDSGFPVDFALTRTVNSADNWWAASRLNQGKYLQTNLTNAEASATSLQFDYMDGWNANAGVSSTLYSWMWKRAPSFFDVVAYKGNLSDTDREHNLGVVPEMIIIKNRTSAQSWAVYHSGVGVNGYLLLTSAGAYSGGSLWNNTAPTDTTFSIASVAINAVNNNTDNYIAYLFASLDGVSKVGSIAYNGTTPVDVDCGFTNGARFVLLKRSDGTGDWIVYDSERGIVAGNDPDLRLNSTAAENSSYDAIDPLSSGFTMNTVFGSGAKTFIFYAIA